MSDGTARADFYTYNNPNSLERKVIEDFLGRAQERLRTHPGRVPVDAKNANGTINWLRGLLDRKPSQMIAEG